MIPALRPASPPFVPLLIDPALRLRPIDLATRDSIRTQRSVRRTNPRSTPRPSASARAAGTLAAWIAPVAAPHVDPVDFSDRESRRVLAAAARAVAYELGREAAREHFAEWIGTPKVS